MLTPSSIRSVRQRGERCNVVSLWWLAPAALSPLSKTLEDVRRSVFDALSNSKQSIRRSDRRRQTGVKPITPRLLRKGCFSALAWQASSPWASSRQRQASPRASRQPTSPPASWQRPSLPASRSSSREPSGYQRCAARPGRPRPRRETRWPAPRDRPPRPAPPRR